METDRLFDTDLVRRNRLRALALAPPGSDFLLRTVTDELIHRLGCVKRKFATALAVHAGADAFARRIVASGRAERVFTVEQDPRLTGTGIPAAVAELERLPFAPASFSLALAPLWLHLANDLPGVLARINRALQPDGLFLAALAGSGTLHELREALLAAEAELTGGACARVIPFAGVRDCGGLLERAGFALPVVDAETYVARYDTAFALMRDLRHMGQANPFAGRGRRAASRKLFVRAAELYAERHGDPDGRIRASFNIVYLSGWKPHPSQQQPLRPGSAKTRLADALGEAGSPGQADVVSGASPSP